VPPESIELILGCEECGALWLPADESRWSAFLTDGEFAFYCPLCAESEFGDS